jgi:hypothetical protein
MARGASARRSIKTCWDGSSTRLGDSGWTGRASGFFGIAALRPFLANAGPLGNVAAAMLGSACRPVRAILFDKSPASNWGLGWHQDRVVAVAGRVEADGFGPWTRKQGALHVTPPFEVLARMVTLRLHIDDT